MTSNVAPFSGFDLPTTPPFFPLSPPSSPPGPQAMKTGTTIAGVTFKDGVVLGADTRATGGTEVADKNCEKIHYLAPNIYCCGAGTAADTEKTTEIIR